MLNIIFHTPTDQRQHLKPEAEAKANNKAIELIGLADKLLQCYGWDIEYDNRIFRCLVMSGFLVTTCSVRPELSVFRILQQDREENLLQLFAATWHWGSGTPELQSYRGGSWEKTFRKIGAENVDLAPSPRLH